MMNNEYSLEISIDRYIYFCSLLHRHDLSFGPLDEVISCGHSTETSSAELGHVPSIFCFLAKSGEFLRIFVVANGVITEKGQWIPSLYRFEEA